MSVAANASAGSALAGRPSPNAARYTVPMVAALNAEGDAPAVSAYSQTTAPATIRYVGRCLPSSHAADPAVTASRTPTCRPEMARRWAAPVLRNFSTSSGGNDPRLPSSITVASADSG